MSHALETVNPIPPMRAELPRITERKRLDLRLLMKLLAELLKSDLMDPESRVHV
jgi:hypothetical protein